MKIPAAIFFLLFILIGCAPKKLTPEQLVELEKTKPSCATEKECEVMWSAARRWVLDNAGMKIQNITNDFIETYNPRKNDTKLGVRVVKEIQPDGKYSLSVDTWCSNVFGCRLNKYDATISFNSSVNAAVQNWKGRSPDL